MDMMQFIHSSKWTEGIVNKLGKYVCSDPRECLHITELSLTSGISDLWKQDSDNNFSFIAWMLTANDFKFEISRQLDQKLNHILNDFDATQPLKTSLRIGLLLRSGLSLLKNNDHFLWWDKETINNKISSHNVRYVNLQGANLAGMDLAGLKLPANLRRANFKGADLSSTDLRGAYLRDALISKEQLDGAIVDRTTELPC
jgi:uncharacterized protein YjbI with pentapeptide repeats